MGNEDQRTEDRKEVLEAQEKVQELKEKLLKFDEDRNEDLYRLTERKLTEAEEYMETLVREYKQKHG